MNVELPPVPAEVEQQWTVRARLTMHRIAVAEALGVDFRLPPDPGPVHYYRSPLPPLTEVEARRRPPAAPPTS